MITIDYEQGRRKCILRTDEDTLSYIRNHFSEKNDGAFFAKRKGKKFVADRFYAITNTGRFDFGLAGEIRKFLVAEQFTDVEYSKEFCEALKSNRIPITEFWDDLKHSARYYQQEPIEKLLKLGCGTVIVGTGGGKSLIQALLLENYIRNVSNETFKCLIIVPGLSLVNQLCDDFKDYGVTFTFSGWTGEKEREDTQVIICNSENLLAKFNQEKNWLQYVDMVIQDECHKIKKSNEVSKVVGKIKTHRKFGFTGTLSEVNIDRWKTIGTFGPIVYEKSSKELRDEKFLTPVKAYGVSFCHSFKKMPYRQEEEYIINHPKRNEYLAKMARKMARRGNTLIMVNRIAHGEALNDLIGGSYFVCGDMPVDERKNIIEKMENGTGVVCIAMSSIFSTGINVKNLHNIILTYGGKSFIRLVQSVGRGLRLHESKKMLTIIDCHDNMKYSMGHWEERCRIYEKEQIPFKDSKEIIL